MRALHYKGWIIWMTQTKWAIDLPDPKKARNHVNLRHHKQLFFPFFPWQWLVAGNEYTVSLLWGRLASGVGGNSWEVALSPGKEERTILFSELLLWTWISENSWEAAMVVSVTREGGEDNTFLRIAAPMIRKTCQGLIAASWEATSCGLPPGRWIIPFFSSRLLLHRLYQHCGGFSPATWS